MLNYSTSTQALGDETNQKKGLPPKQFKEMRFRTCHERSLNNNLKQITEIYYVSITGNNQGTNAKCEYIENEHNIHDENTNIITIILFINVCNYYQSLNKIVGVNNVVGYKLHFQN